MPEEKSAVYYARKYQIGLMRRLFIDFVDGMVLLFVWITAFLVIRAVGIPLDSRASVFLITVLATNFLYMVIMKRFARTLGYVICGAQVVNYQGQRPSIGCLSFRALFVFIGPGNSLLDLIWLSGDPHGQAIRDKMSRSYVVRSGSQPAGRGHVRYVRVLLLGYQLLLPEVTRDGAAVLEKS